MRKVGARKVGDKFLSPRGAGSNFIIKSSLRKVGARKVGDKFLGPRGAGSQNINKFSMRILDFRRQRGILKDGFLRGKVVGPCARISGSCVRSLVSRCGACLLVILHSCFANLSPHCRFFAAPAKFPLWAVYVTGAAAASLIRHQLPRHCKYSIPL